MTLVQMQPYSMSATPVHRTAADAMDTGGPQVCDDMTVEVALSVMASARTGHLIVCDNDGLCTGLLTQAQLTAARDSSAYTDRIQLRDILGDRGPFPLPDHPGRSRARDALQPAQCPACGRRTRQHSGRPRPCSLNRLNRGRTIPLRSTPVRHHALCHRPLPIRPHQERRPGVDEGRQARAGFRRVRDHRPPHLPRQAGRPGRHTPGPPRLQRRRSPPSHDPARLHLPRPSSAAAPTRVLNPLQEASAMLGAPAAA